MLSLKNNSRLSKKNVKGVTFCIFITLFDKLQIIFDLSTDLMQQFPLIRLGADGTFMISCMVVFSIMVAIVF